MNSAKLWILLAALTLGSVFSPAQTPPNLENGFKRWGSYEGSSVDSVNNLNGNQMLHGPLLPNYPQRGGSLTMQSFLYQTSKSWQVFCTVALNNEVTCQWGVGRAGVELRQSEGLTIQRTLQETGDGTGQNFFKAYGYTIQDATGAMHQVVGSGPLDTTGESTKFDSIDTSGYHMEMSNPDSNGVMNTATVTDRHGNQYVASSWIGGTDTGPTLCPQLPGNQIAPAHNGSPVFGGGGVFPPIIDDAPMGQQDCLQAAFAGQITDSNGNFISNPEAGPTDTLGRSFSFFRGGTPTTDYSGCVSSHTISSAVTQTYTAPDGSTRQIKLCYGNIPIATAFNVSGIVELTGATFQQLVTVVLGDGTKWTFDYDSYGETTSVGLPTGGSIAYTWTTIAFPSCAPFDGGVSRAVATRTLSGNNGPSSIWRYNWGTVVSGVISNTVTDPLNNDTVHVFTAQEGTGTCSFYETQTRSYQGTGGQRRLLKQVDTSYSKSSFNIETISGSGLGNVFATDITTTVYPNGKVKKVHRDPDLGLGAGQPIFGNIKKELEYDWGQGAPGALLRETDTTYQWEINPAYRPAGLLDLPASVIVKDAGGNRVAETDYSYDETADPSYLTSASISTQHNSVPPAGVRGNQTTVSRWLNTTNSFVPSHTKWYDTGEVYQSIDPLGHTTTHSYDPFYKGAYGTETCSPTTNGVAHCVSGTYDFNTGVLTSLTNENATTQASGNTPGDSGHTSNYVTDFQWRITSAQAPPDPANGNMRATTSFNFSAPNSFPVNVQRTKSVTTALSDSATSFFDGLGRGYKGQHVLPNGTATVDTTLDLAGHPATVSNPYFTTADPTYGTTTNAYDALDRVTQTTKQDGSISSVAYSVLTSVAANGDCTVTTDEAGKQRGACADALGRLVEVDESSGATVQANYHALMQADGNFVLLNSAGTSVWSTGSGATNAASIFMQDDGNLVTYIFRWQAGVYAAPTPGSYPSSSCSIGTYLVAGQMLPSGKCIVSPHGQYFLLMNTDGNFFIYDWAHGTGTWGPGTQGHPGAYAIFQTDGNLVVYDVNGTALWNSGTSGTYAERLDLNDDGRIIIWKSAWNSGTSDGQFNGTMYTHPSCDVGIGTGTTGLLWPGQCFVSPNGRFELLMQADGNMVIYDRSVTPNAAIWSTGTGFSTADPSVAYRTLYFYDALGNLTCVEQHGDATTGTGCSAASSNDATSPWRVRRFTYDSFSRLLTAKNPESGTITYTYDNDGNLLQKTSPAPNQTGSAAQTVSYCYDELHRVTGKGYGVQSCPLGTPVVTYAYDTGANAIGHLTSLIDQAGTASYSYDILGRMTSETRTLTGANNGAISKSLSYEYNLDGSLYKLHYPSGAVVTYTPDSAGRTLSAVDSGSGINYVTGATYGPDSALTGFISGSGGAAAITSSFTYNKRLQPLTMSATAAPSQTVYSIGYDFHAGNGTAGSGTDNGNVYGIINYKDTTHGRDQAFTYDALNRVLTAQNAGTDCTAKVLQNKTEYWGNSYGYDAWGNLLQKTITKCGAEHLSVTADAHNWLHASGTDYQYDAAGNMTYDATAALSYTFDQENRLTGAAGYTYTYDGDGDRVRKSNGNLAGNGTLYWYMTPGVVAESQLDGTLKSEYVFFDGERVARKDFPGNTVAYYFSDHLKTASVITDSAGVIKAESDYYPWGGELQFVNNDSNDYKFTGKKRDLETGLDYFGARYYGNALGRWTSPDNPFADQHKSDPQTWNLYMYARNNPLRNVDPNGRGIIDWVALGRAVSNWWNSGVKRDGGAGNFAKNNGIGVAKGGGQVGVALAVGGANQLAPGLGYNLLSTKTGMKVGNAVMPSNQTQAEAVPVGQFVATTVVTAGIGAGIGALEGGAVSTEATLARLATQAVDNVGPGSGAAYGTAVHSEFADLVEANTGLATEVSYKGGQVVEYGTAGSVRVDVVEGPIDAPTCCYDLKTGSATLTPARTAQIQNELPGGSNVPVKEIKPQ